MTDSLGRTSTTKQTVLVPSALINRVGRPVSTCERPASGNRGGGENQSDSKDCVKTFSFGIVEVNSRGTSDQCFQVVAREHQHRALQSRASAAPKGSLGVLVDYHARIAGPVALNGLPVNVPKSVVTNYDSGDQTISLGTFPIQFTLPGGQLVHVADIDLTTKVVPVRGRFKLGGAKVASPGLKDYGGLKLGGGAEFDLLSGGTSETRISLKLPNFFNAGVGKEAEGQVTLRASNVGGFDFEGTQIKVPVVFLGPIQLSDLYFNYKRKDQVWEGGANIQLTPFLPQIKASPPPADYGFGMRMGKFDHAGVGVAFLYPPRPQLFPGVGLKELGVAIGINPTRLTGRLAVDFGSFLAVDGTAFVALASPDRPYDFPEEFAPPGLEFLAGRRLDSFSIAVGGDFKLNVPRLGDLKLATAHVFYAAPDYVEFGGGFTFDLGKRLKVKGGVDGFAEIARGKFNLEGKVDVCVDIDVLDFCKGVSAVVSSKGIGFCTIVPVPLPPPFGPRIPVTAGLGYKWGQSTPDLMIFTCDHSPYREVRSSARSAQAARGFTLGAGLPSAMVRVVGQGGAPNLVLSGPHGQRITIPQTDQAHPSPDVFDLRIADQNTTLVALRKPSAGRWTVAAQPGSPAISSVAAADGLADPSVHASVSGRAGRRTLAYRIKPASGQSVTFAERGTRTYRVIGKASGARGRIRFAPAAGRRGSRTVLAIVERNGVPTTTLKVAQYVASSPARPARPRGLRIRRRAGALVVSWRPVPGAVQYLVNVRLSYGRQILRVTRQAQHPHLGRRRRRPRHRAGWRDASGHQSRARGQRDDSAVAPRPRRYSSASTASTSLPSFSPLNSLSSVSGKFSMPATTSSRDLSCPDEIHWPISPAPSA